MSALCAEGRERADFARVCAYSPPIHPAHRYSKILNSKRPSCYASPPPYRIRKLTSSTVIKRLIHVDQHFSFNSCTKRFISCHPPPPSTRPNIDLTKKDSCQLGKAPFARPLTQTAGARSSGYEGVVLNKTGKRRILWLKNCGPLHYANSWHSVSWGGAASENCCCSQR